MVRIQMPENTILNTDTDLHSTLHLIWKMIQTPDQSLRVVLGLHPQFLSLHLYISIQEAEESEVSGDYPTKEVYKKMGAKGLLACRLTHELSTSPNP